MEKDKIFLEIAKKHLFLDTLETRRSDSLDFHDHAVWSVKAAMDAAYQAGFAAGRRRPRKTKPVDRAENHPMCNETTFSADTDKPSHPADGM